MARRPSPTIANPEYLADPKVKEQFIEQLESVQDMDNYLSGSGRAFLEGRMSAAAFSDSHEHVVMSHFPEDYGRAIPEGGAWVMVKHPPVAEITVPVLSIWYALPRTRGGLTFKRGVKGGFPRHMAEITTPDGALNLNPWEYTVVKDIRNWMGMEEDGVEMHWLGADGIDDERLFFMQARGIPRKDALTVLLPELENGAFVYFTIPEEYGAYFGLTA